MRETLIRIEKRILPLRGFIKLIYLSLFFRIGLTLPFLVRRKWSGGADGGDSSFKILWLHFSCNYAMFWTDYYGVYPYFKPRHLSGFDISKIKVFRTWGIDELYYKLYYKVN